MRQNTRLPQLANRSIPHRHAKTATSPEGCRFLHLRHTWRVVSGAFTGSVRACASRSGFRHAPVLPSVFTRMNGDGYRQDDALGRRGDRRQPGSLVGDILYELATPGRNRDLTFFLGVLQKTKPLPVAGGVCCISRSGAFLVGHPFRSCRRGAHGVSPGHDEPEYDGIPIGKQAHG